MQNRLGNLIRPPSKKLCYHQGFFAVKRRAVFILGAMWWALVRGWRRDCVVGGMETRFQWRKAHSRTAKCEAFHFAPRLFFMFLFQSLQNFPQNRTNLLGWGNKKKEIGGDFLFFVVETKGFEPLTSAMWLQRSKPAGLRLYFRLAMQSNKKFGDLATYWRFFLSWRGVFSGFS